MQFHIPFLSSTHLSYKQCTQKQKCWKSKRANYLSFKTNHTIYLFSAFSLCDSSLLWIFYCTHAVIGTAFALNMLFNIPVWIGVLLTGLSTLILLALQQYGVLYHILFLSWKKKWFSLHVILGTIHVKTTRAFFVLLLNRLGNLNSWLHFLYLQLLHVLWLSLDMQSLMLKKL